MCSVYGRSTSAIFGLDRFEGLYCGVHATQGNEVKRGEQGFRAVRFSDGGAAVPGGWRGSASRARLFDDLHASEGHRRGRRRRSRLRIGPGDRSTVSGPCSERICSPSRPSLCFFGDGELNQHTLSSSARLALSRAWCDHGSHRIQVLKAARTLVGFDGQLPPNRTN
jgi:hypothetical protein